MTRVPTGAVAIYFGCAVVLAGCSREAEPVERNDPAQNVSADVSSAADLKGANGDSLGTLKVSENAAGVTIALAGSGIPPGTHGIHLHEKGLCQGTKFESAGAHWNPSQRKHGRDNPAGAHLGDLANFEVSETGTASASFAIPGVAMRRGATPLADSDGTSIVVHAKADDYKTDPSGNSGDRVACAVISPPQ